jgi:DNA-directed RNA polymerase subunit RPC12/RpoP
MRCTQCGGKLRRIHRSFLERFSYLAIYKCRQCEQEQCVPRRYRYHFGPEVRCPECGTFRLSRLKQPDKIDRMQRGPWNYAERLGGGKLYHCKFCRLQFYDRRRLAAEPAPTPVNKETPAEGQPSQPLEQ